MQLLQNNNIRFCLQLDKRQHIGTENFDKFIWLPIDQRFKQCLSTSVFKFVSEMCPQYMNEIYTTTNENNTVPRNCPLKLFQLLRSKALSQKCSSYLGSFVWNGCQMMLNCLTMWIRLTLSWRRPLSCGNHLLRKSMDRFLNYHHYHLILIMEL